MCAFSTNFGWCRHFKYLKNDQQCPKTVKVNYKGHSFYGYKQVSNKLVSKIELTKSLNQESFHKTNKMTAA